MKLSAAIVGFWLDKKREFSRNTYRNYNHWFRLFMGFVGDIEFAEITTTHVKRYLNHLADDKGYGKRSISDSWAPLSSLWTWAEVELGTPHIIRGRVAFPSYPDTLIEPFTEGEIRALLVAAEYGKPWTTRKGKTARSKRPTADRDRAIILVLLDCGLRASELCDLTIGDYDSNRGRLQVRHGKGDKPRLVYLGDRARKSLWRYLADREITPDCPLFATKTGGRLERNHLRQSLQVIADNAGVTGLTVHRFRHTFAITFLRNGGNLAALQAILGHSNIEMSLHYARLAEVDIENAGRSYSPADNWKL